MNHAVILTFVNLSEIYYVFIIQFILTWGLGTKDIAKMTEPLLADIQYIGMVLDKEY